MWQALKKGAYEQAALEMKDSRWYAQVGKRADRLIKMMLKGVEREFKAVGLLFGRF